MQAEEVSGLVLAYGDDVYRFARKLYSHVPDAEDLYQQTFLKVLEKNFFNQHRKKSTGVSLFCGISSVQKRTAQKGKTGSHSSQSVAGGVRRRCGRGRVSGVRCNETGGMEGFTPGSPYTCRQISDSHTAPLRF